jgi:hypothetical protein
MKVINENTTFARIRFNSFQRNKQGTHTNHRRNRAVMILGLWEKEGYALVRYLSYHYTGSFRVAISALKEF